MSNFARKFARSQRDRSIKWDDNKELLKHVRKELSILVYARPWYDLIVRSMMVLVRMQHPSTMELAKELATRFSVSWLAANGNGVMALAGSAASVGTGPGGTSGVTFKMPHEMDVSRVVAPDAAGETPAETGQIIKQTLDDMREFGQPDPEVVAVEGIEP